VKTASTVLLLDNKHTNNNPQQENSQTELEKIFQFTGKANIVLLDSYEQLMWLS